MSEQGIQAPELPDNLEWFNTDAPIRLADHRGKVILLDFWTYSNINCLHVLADLEYLRRKYDDRLVIIGLHTPKFPSERIGENLQKAINRHYIRHAVAHDPDFTVWRQYGIQAWPSIIFIDPKGEVIGVLRGEGRRRQIDFMIQEYLDRASEEGIQITSSLTLTEKREPLSALKFPSKVLATDKHLFISDSGKNRILEANRDGRVVNIYGSSTSGLIDGMYNEAAFNQPQGLAIRDNFLFVADEANHAVRQIDLIKRDVTTIAGTGKQRLLTDQTITNPRETDINSPWDVHYLDRKLYIAMAGTHQIWMLDMNSNKLSILAGNGRANIDDGYVDDATFAQPSGLTYGEYLDSTMFVIDAETSALRGMRLRDGRVTTYVGTGLFDYGDNDGKGKDARLQRPLDIVYDDARNLIWIADTYNNKIKTYNLASGMVTTVNVDHPLNFPSGIDLHRDELWIANTNSHEIVKLDINAGHAEVVEIFEVEYDF